MNRSELVDAIAKATGSTKVAAEQHLKATVEAIQTAVAKGDDVAILGFGTFGVKETAARTGRNPRTGAELKIAAKRSAKFKAGKAFNDAVAAGGKGKKK